MVNRYSPFDAEQMEADLGGDYVDYADYQKLETLLVDFTRAVGEALIRAKGSEAETACKHETHSGGVKS